MTKHLKAWQKKFDLLKAYIAKHGTFPDRQNTCSETKSLVYWCDHQRKLYKKQSLSAQQIHQLSAIQFNWEAHDFLWDEYAESLKTYYHQHKSWPPLKTVYKEKNLGTWCIRQRQLKKKGLLTEKKIKCLNDINFVWDVGQHTWQQQFQKLKHFYQTHQRWPKAQESYEGSKLGLWVQTQRQLHKKEKLSADKFESLKDIGFFQGPQYHQWNSYYKCLQAFYKQYQQAPTAQVTFNQLEIGTWYEKQLILEQKNLLTNKQKQQLKHLFKNESPKKITWHDYYESLDRFIQEKKDNPKQNETYEGLTLGKWVNMQRFKYKNNKLSAEQIKKLNMIKGFYWNAAEKEWLANYHTLLNYIHTHKQLPKANDVYQDRNIGRWCNKQQYLYKQGKLAANRIKYLQDIQYQDSTSEAKITFPLSAQFNQWEENLSLLKEFIRIKKREPKQLETFESKALGRWYATQKTQQKNKTLKQEKKDLLNEIIHQINKKKETNMHHQTSYIDQSQQKLYKKPSYYFYDLETFGKNPKTARIAQFAGVRTDENFNIIDEPLICYCKIQADSLPSIVSCMVTGITPQISLEKGLTEQSFIKTIITEFLKPNTCILGYNSFKFDDEVIRHTLFRNLIDPYKREYNDNNSRWDVLKAMYAVRDLRPESLNWKTQANKAASLKLEDITAANHISHTDAHDAMADVTATIEVVKLLKSKNPSLLNYLIQNKNKATAQTFLDKHLFKAIIHISPMLSNEYGASALVCPIMKHPVIGSQYIVINLAQSPEKILSLSPEEINEKLYTKGLKAEERLALKTIKITESPLMFPLGNALKDTDMTRLQIKKDSCMKHLAFLKNNQEAIKNQLHKAYSIPYPDQSSDPELQLYSGFINRFDQQHIQHKGPENLLGKTFSDSRLEPLIWRLIGRNHPEKFDEQNTQKWQAYCSQKLQQPISDETLDIDSYMKLVTGALALTDTMNENEMKGVLCEGLSEEKKRQFEDEIEGVLLRVKENGSAKYKSVFEALKEYGEQIRGRFLK